MSALSRAAIPHPPAHPRGLYTLFFTELWERFSYYGMRALLVLFMVDRARHGLGMDDTTATAIYGLYTAAVYLAALPGGWCGDRWFGAQTAVSYGGLLIAAGHFTMALPFTATFYAALVLIVAGTGLLKPNISVMVGGLYPEGGTRRDSGFTLFYMGINLGAFLGPVVCSTLGERINWHVGFAVAGVGMTAGLAQYRWSQRHLGNVGLCPASPFHLNRKHLVLFSGIGLVIAALIALAFTGGMRFDAVALASGASRILGAGAVIYFTVLLIFGRLSRSEKIRVAVIGLLFVLSAVFWAGFEQAGSSFNLFAERYTERGLGFLRFTIPAGWFQSLGAFFVISLAPAFSMLWLMLARRGIEPGTPIKFAVGLIFLGCGFLVMAGASSRAVGEHKAWPTWLIGTYLLHSLGELCLSPVGLSSVTKLAPRRLAGQMMGIWFVATALGNLLAGLLAGQVASSTAVAMSGHFLELALLPIGLGMALLFFAKWLNRWSSQPPAPDPEPPVPA